MVNGRVWPVADETTLWLPPGPVAVETSSTEPPLRVLDFNGDLKSAAVQGSSVDLAYQSAARAIAILDRRPVSIEIDGAPAKPTLLESAPGRYALLLPRGQHLVTFCAR